MGGGSRSLGSWKSKSVGRLQARSRQPLGVQERLWLVRQDRYAGGRWACGRQAYGHLLGANGALHQPQAAGHRSRPCPAI